MSEEYPRAILRPATKSDFPKKYIHKSTLLITPDAYDHNGDVYWVWVTVARRRNQQLKLFAYLGGAQIKAYGPEGNTRECFDAGHMTSWNDTKGWLNGLSELRCQINKHTDDELKSLADAFANIIPEWFPSKSTKIKS
jgi:hypothetical protein